MTKKLEVIIGKLAIIEVAQALLKARRSGQIIPDVVFEIIEEVKDNLK